MTERARGGWAVAAAAVGFFLAALVIGSLGPGQAGAAPTQVCPPICPSSTTAEPTTEAPTTAAPTTHAPATAPLATTARPRTTAATLATTATTVASTTASTAPGEPVSTGSVPLLVPGPTDVGGATVTTAAPAATKPASTSDNTGTVVALVIAGLLLVAVLLAVLTYWYWRNTRPGVAWADEQAPTEADEVGRQRV